MNNTEWTIARIAQRLDAMVRLIAVIRALPPDLPGRWSLPDDCAGLTVWLNGEAEAAAWRAVLDALRDRMAVRELAPESAHGYAVTCFLVNGAPLQLVLPDSQDDDPWVVYVETLDMEGLPS
jgi:hypothetical protein